MKKVVAKWTYTPNDYFDTEILIENENQSITIKDGVIELKLSESDDADVSETHSKYIGYVESFLMVGLLNKRKNYELRASTLTSTNADGSVSTFVKLTPASSTIEVALKISYRKMDKDGNVIFDSIEEEKKKQVELLNKIQTALNKDPLVKGLFESYKNSISDPENELVHIYEIRDALQNHFRSKSKALEKLNLTTKEWSDFGTICNEKPLKEGRHRGQMKGKLRNASKEELKLAREISIKMINAFIDYLNT